MKDLRERIALWLWGVALTIGGIGCWIRGSHIPHAEPNFIRWCPQCDKHEVAAAHDANQEG